MFENREAAALRSAVNFQSCRSGGCRRFASTRLETSEVEDARHKRPFNDDMRRQSNDNAKHDHNWNDRDLRMVADRCLEQPLVENHDEKVGEIDGVGCLTHQDSEAADRMVRAGK